MLQDRVVLVTGAGGAIGSAIARQVVDHGGHAIVHDRTSDLVEPIARELASASSSVVADLGAPDSTSRLWEDAVACRGRIDVLVNNAGIYPPAPLESSLESWLSVWDRSLAVNLVAPAILCRDAVTTFATQPQGGIIINFASRAAFRGEDPDYWHYAAAKAGIVAMTRTIARQYGRSGITAFVVAPGYVDTPFNQVFRDTFGVEVAAEQTGIGEVAQPDDVANIVTFLASGRARHATGTTIDINGASYVR